MMKNIIPKWYITFFLLVLLSNCTSNQTHIKEQEEKFVIENNSEVGCFNLAENYCKSLYADSSLGNIEIIRPSGNISIRQGETLNNFSQQFYSYSRAKLKAKDKLPVIFNKTLDELDYFNKLNELLSRKPRSQMTLVERIHFDRLSSEVETIWDTALEETIIKRMTYQYPGFQRIANRDMPPEYEIEYQKVRRRLHNQISMALWHEDKNWAKVEATFEKLQESFSTVIDRLAIDESVKSDFKNRIKTIKLTLPGSRPEIPESECSSTTVNAFYYKYLNLITVCAGDFNSEDILQTLAHEMSHALDFSRSIYNFKMNTELVNIQKNIRKQVCETKKIDCNLWNNFKTELPNYLNKYLSYRPVLKEFNQCLKLKHDTLAPKEEDYQRIAKSGTGEIFSSFASSDNFLRITKERLPLRNGKIIKNPYYLNPCKYYHWSSDEEPPEDEINSLVYFTAEYMCTEGNLSEKFKQSLETSKKLTEQVLTETLKLGGEFSSNSAMIDEGFSSPSNERYADVFGSYVIKEYLKSFNSIEDRRGKFLASLSWLCSEPSLTSHFPEESLIQSKYLNSLHTSGNSRFKEILAQPIRSSLKCKKDFEINECFLPLLPDSK